jgi:hypothetical protein
MQIRYFAVDQLRQLIIVPNKAFAQLWQGKIAAATLGEFGDREFPVISVICDDDLLPKKMYLLRMPLLAGHFTEESLYTLRLFSRADCVTPREAFNHHSSRWPKDLFRQLAVALDVPVAGLNVPLGIGGPLLVAATMRINPREALRQHGF